MIQAKAQLHVALATAVKQLAPDSTLVPQFEQPKQAAHGDLAITAAMQLAKPLRSNPRAVAQQLIDALQAQPAIQQWVEADGLNIAGPGFINLRLKPAAKQAVVREVLDSGPRFGRQSANGQKLMVEFVSANPTGPLHVGHARQGALGDSLCHLFETQGYEVLREFYYNDAGVQIATLANSVQCRIRGLSPGHPDWPESAYNGDYIQDIADDFLAKKTVKADDREFTASGDPDDLDGIRQFAVAYLRHEQDLDLQAFGVQFDSYYLESSLYTSGRVEDTVAKLVASGKTYEQDGALWLKSTDYGDDKDRVMRKSDGTFTYFLPDVAYHIAKFERGYTTCINCQGTDHHGTIARVRAGLQAVGLGIPQGFPSYVLNTMVRVVRDGAEVKISKRAGSYVTLRDLIEWTSRDAVRFFLISRKADTEFTFDIDLALKQNDDNPVFYVQYAHARICAVLRLQLEKIAGEVSDEGTDDQGSPANLSNFIASILELLDEIKPKNDARNKAHRTILNRLAMILQNAGKSNQPNVTRPQAREIREILTNPHDNKREIINRISNISFTNSNTKKWGERLLVALREAHKKHYHAELQPYFSSIPREKADQLVEKLLIRILRSDADLALLQEKRELDLMAKISEYPIMLTTATTGLAPHDVTFYLRELSGMIHAYYATTRIVNDKNPSLTTARLALLCAAKQIIANGLKVLGIKPKRTM